MSRRTLIDTLTLSGYKTWIAGGAILFLGGSKVLAESIGVEYPIPEHVYDYLIVTLVGMMGLGIGHKVQKAALLVACLCLPLSADISGATAAAVGEPVKLTIDTDKAEWVFVGDGITSTAHVGGRWVIVYSSQAGQITAVAAHNDSGAVEIDTHVIQVGGVAPTPPDSKLDNVFRNAIEGKVPLDQVQLCADLAQNFRTVAGLVHSGKVAGTGKAIGARLVPLNKRIIGESENWAGVFSGINTALDALEAAGGLRTSESYEAVLLSIARVLEREAE